MASRPARVAMLEQFKADGVKYMFGNPGTVEQGFLDELRGFPEIEYVLALQEAVVVGIADGYARATRTPTLLQLHSGVGLGNGIGMLYQAMRGHAPLVVVVGESGLAYDSMDAQMAADLVGMAKPVTKWATRVVDPESTLRVLRRAFKVAATPPYGPVLVVLPADVLDRPTSEPAVPTSYLHTAVVPDAGTIGLAASLLAAAERPLIIAGDGVHFADAQAELARFAEVWGAEVWGADWAEVNLPADHPLYQGQLGHMFGENSSRVTAAADAVLIVGTYALPEVYPLLDGVFAEGAPVVHIDLDSGAIAKNFPVDLGLVADPKLSLARLTEALTERQSAERQQAVAERIQGLADKKAAAYADAVARDLAADEGGPLTAAYFGRELSRQLPPDAVLFDEALTSSPGIFRYNPPNEPGHWHQTRGGSLGVGIPGAIGAKLAHPERTVVGFTGDGGSMYTVQGLWTAARYDIAAKFVICNNGRYKLLDDNIEQYWRSQDIEHHDFPGIFDLSRPEIDFAALSESLGVPAVRVEKPAEVAPAIARALAHPGPFLIDLVIGRD
ncbi:MULTISPECIES: thiamine pyrophosphate-binding protein [unclassified Kitasatospora]|uniref:thiamine pyrophosphate-binding protein n=1 Tax=unclassified Kitasatospora TaxID=2633591 RepID=UPI00070C58C8|nr:MULTISPECIES: thiamine pyrophosphate-binding protein [unclassified Kitasatospora]KQV15305.1 thiamine pyrophosphate-binding protein [Kitasatospora sp. Root107]KRB64106.1 thiamine pyrophosphate-binding protein [Kitasatospora sp. Root187]